MTVETVKITTPLTSKLSATINSGLLLPVSGSKEMPVAAFSVPILGAFPDMHLSLIKKKLPATAAFLASHE
jgi:hypothetical protein